MSELILTGRIEHASCPVCGTPTTFEHTRSAGRPAHAWRCPQCGPCAARVMYDCADCQASGDLTKAEKQFLALAIQGLCMRVGPDLFVMAREIAAKLGMTAELEASLKDWIGFSQEIKRDGQ